MSEKKYEYKGILFFLIILLVIVLIIFIPNMSQNKKENDAKEHEQNLITQGKIEEPQKIINDFIEIFKNKDEVRAKKIITDDFIYINNNNNYESNYISNFLDDTNMLVAKYDIEERTNSLQGEKTYWIYWNIPEGIIKEQYSQYALQRIFIYMKRTVEEEKITYKIYKIILRNNI